jgi:hypothetical protein
MFYVVGMGNLPDSDELAGYYYLTNPTGCGRGGLYREVAQQPQVTLGAAGKQ